MPSGGNETYIGSVKSPGDAIKLFEACRLGLLPRIQRRLSEKERQDIKSGSVFVWDEKEAGMRRWTDGKSWSASRVVGSFLQYREMEGKRGTAGFGTSRRSTGRLAEAGQPSDEEQEAGQETYRYKAGGLVKQSFSITTSTGQHLHLIAYYVQQPPGAPEMQQPSTDPALRHITPIRGMYPESSIHDAASSPAVTRMPINPYVGPPAHPDPGAYGNHYAPPAWTAREPSPWPPSPRRTPPHAFARHEAEMIQPAHMGYGPQLAAPHGAMNPSHNPRMPQPTAWSAVDRQLSLSPRSQHLQAQAAQAVLIDPRVSSDSHHQHRPLTLLAPLNRQPTPPRTSSHSPPRTGSSSSSQPRNLSLSSIMHTQPIKSEPTSANAANSSSAGSSPRALVPAAYESSVDEKALRSLDRHFGF